MPRIARTVAMALGLAGGLAGLAGARVHAAVPPAARRRRSTSCAGWWRASRPTRRRSAGTATARIRRLGENADELARRQGEAMRAQRRPSGAAGGPAPGVRRGRLPRPDAGAPAPRRSGADARGVPGLPARPADDGGRAHRRGRRLRPVLGRLALPRGPRPGGPGAAATRRRRRRRSWPRTSASSPRLTFPPTAEADVEAQAVTGRKRMETLDPAALLGVEQKPADRLEQRLAAALWRRVEPDRHRLRRRRSGCAAACRGWTPRP